MAIEAASLNGKIGPRALRRSHFILAADLGQSTDPTAIAVIHHEVWEQFHQGKQKWVKPESFAVRHLARLPLGLSYVDQVAAIAELLTRPPLNTRSTILVLDESGVGRAVADLFDDAGLNPLRVTITAGNEQSSAGRDRWHVAKSILISLLDAKLHTKELRFAADLREADAMREELRDFTRKVSAAGRFSFSAREGKHDDLVLAVAIGLWAAAGRPEAPRAMFGTYSRLAPRMYVGGG